MTRAFVDITPALRIPMRELEFRFSRSGGPGGQHVNKTETRVELLFDVCHSPSLSAAQRSTLVHAWARRLDADGVLHIVSSEERSQLRNRERAVERFVRMTHAALQPRAARVPTVPTRSSRERRLESKRMTAARKRLRAQRSDE